MRQMVGEAVTTLWKTRQKKNAQKHIAACRSAASHGTNTVSNAGTQATVFYPLLELHKISTGNLKTATATHRGSSR